MKNLKLKILLITLSGSLYTASSLASNDLGGWQPQIVEKMYVFIDSIRSPVIESSV